MVLYTMSGDTLRIHATAFLDTVETQARPNESLGYQEAYPGERRDALLRGLASIDGAGPQLEFRETLGEGAMGIVRLAVQPSVMREVAVKSLRPSVKAQMQADAEAASLMTRRLLEEAWVTGAIEHPNIVPIYDIGREPDGNPFIVMRKIVGRSWQHLLADPVAKARMGDDAWLEAHLRTLIQVSNAVAAAHAQGIVHRDLKPENVMLGQYGEVYVVDWGIAVLVEPERHAHLPILGAMRLVVGTPCYMAPEMLAGDAQRATDVYLLGAIAYEIATGMAPHDQPTMAAAIESILATPPSIPEDLDEGLALLLRRALSRDPLERPASAAEFASLLEHYLTTRASVQTAHIGLRDLAELVRVTQEGSRATSAQVEGLFGAARFSFQTALRQWPENSVAKNAMLDAHLVSGTFALRNDDPDHALAIAKSSDIPQSDARVVAFVQQATEAARIRRARLETLARRGDAEGGLRTRSMLSSIVAAFWLVFTGVSWWHKHAFGSAYRYELAIAASVQAVVWFALTKWSNRTMYRTEFNKRIAQIGYAIPLSLAALALFLDRLGYREEEVFSACVIACGSYLVAVTIVVGKRAYLLNLLGFCVCGAAVFIWPALRHVGMFGAAVCALAVSLFVSLRAKRAPLSERTPSI